MFSKIAAFEIRYQIRNPVFVVTLVLFGLLSFGNVTSDNVQLASVGNINIDSPDAIASVHLIMSLIAIFIVTAFMSNIVLRDTELRTAEMMYTTRVRKHEYLLGRFTGAFIVSCVAFSAVTIGMIIGTTMPWLDPERLGGFVAGNYIYALFVLAIPNILFTGAIAFAIATLTRSLMLTYVGVVAFFTLYAISQNILSEPESRALAAMLDPFGIGAYAEVTRYWTAFERNARLIPLEGLFLYNRLLWSGIGLVLIGITYALFRFETESRKSRKFRRQREKGAPAEQDLPSTRVRKAVVAPSFSSATAWSQLALRIRFEVWSVLRGVPFLILVALAVALTLANFLNLGQFFGTPVYPVTRVMTSLMSGTFTLSLIIVAVYYGAELVWRERQLGFHEILDATPTPNWVFVSSKLIAILVIMAALLFTGVLVSVAAQFFSGYTDFELGVYLSRHMLDYGRIPYMAAILSIFIQILVRNKFLGMGLMMLYIVSLFVLVPMGFEDPLYRYGSRADAPFSDMNGWGHYGPVVLLYSAYWALFGVLLFMAMHVLWTRGMLDTLRNQFRRARHAITPAIVITAVVALAGFAGIGGYLYYNTHVLNEYRTLEDIEQAQVEYEKRYRKYEGVPQPRIVDVYAEVDIHPDQTRYEARGHMVLENRTDVPIEEVYVGINDSAVIDLLELEGATAREHDADFNQTVFALNEPLSPGNRLTLRFETRRENPGFLHRRNQSEVIGNGTFFYSTDAMPYLGFSRGNLLVDRNRRRKYDLEPIKRFADLDDASAYGNSYLRQDSDWVNFEAVVSTVQGQTAIAPGYLQRDWVDGNRHYFHYKMDEPMQNLFAFLSADYEIVNESWNGIDIEVYYHKPHEFNVERMIDSVKKSITYFSDNFSPYQYRQLRILEFPVSRGSFAQSFPNTIPWSEGIGFIARLKEATDIDYVFYVGAHEVAHQWWGHQVSSANVQGQTVLVETLAQYSALMVMEKEYGPHVMRRFLKYELDRYLAGRGGEIIEELPLYRVENQPYIHYRKGSVVMYALKDYLGEDAINRALAKLIEETAYRYDPYPTSRDLIRNLRAVAETEAQQDLISDLFERITIFDLSVKEAEVSETDDGKFDVALTISARKMEADGEGREEEIPLDMNIDIGLFTMHPGDETFGEAEVIHLDKQRIMTGESKIEFTVDRRPQHVGIDPYNKLIDRNTDDNLKVVDDAET